MEGLTTRHDAKMHRLQERLASGRGNRDRIRRKLQNTKARRHLALEKQNQPVQPWNTAYEESKNQLGLARDQAMEAISNQRRGVENQFGFLDTSNPYSRVAALQQSFQRDKAISEGEFAQQGQLYSGAYQRRMDSDLTNFGGQQNALQQEYLAELQGLTDAELQAQAAYDQGILGAEKERLAASLEQRPEDAPRRPDYVKKFLKRRRKNRKNRKPPYNNEGRPNQGKPAYDNEGRPA